MAPPQFNHSSRLPVGQIGRNGLRQAEPSRSKN
jgi:hypothetical protein